MAISSLHTRGALGESVPEAAAVPHSSYELIDLLRPHAPAEVRDLSSEQLKQLITEWYKDHPAYADQPFYAWCKKLKDNNAPRVDPRQGGRNRSQHFKFPFQRTSRAQ